MIVVLGCTKVGACGIVLVVERIGNVKTIKIDDDSADKLVLDILTEQLLWLKKTPSKHPEDEAWQIELMDGLEKVIRNW